MAHPSDVSSGNTLPDILRAHADRQPERRVCTFLRDGEADAVHLGYGQLDLQARAVAALAVWRQADARLQQGAGDSYKRSIEAAAAWRRTTDYHCSFTRLSSLAESS